MSRIELSGDGVFTVAEVVIGCNMHSMIFAEENNIPVIYVDTEQPHFFDDSSVKEFAEISFYLSLHGLVPFSDLVTGLRVDVEDRALIVSCGPKSYTVLYDKLYIFSDNELQGLPAPERKNKFYKVLDWLDISTSRGIHNTIVTDSDFLGELHFYPSLRTGRKGFCDAVAVSYMTEEQLRHPDWSDTYIKLKAEGLLKAAGIEGVSNGDRTREVVVSHSHREEIPVNKNSYGEVPHVEFR